MENQPVDERAFRQVGYQLIDLVSQHLYRVRERPVYQPVPHEVQRALTDSSLPEQGYAPEEVLDFLQTYIVPFATFGYGHPRAFGWIAGEPDPLAVLGSLVSAALNPNALGGDQSATYLELTVLRWLQELIGFPHQESAGLLVSGGTQAMLHALLVALHTKTPCETSVNGWRQKAAPWIIYASDQAHQCLQSCLEVLGLGRQALHLVASDEQFRIDVRTLATTIQRDRASGLHPLCLIGNAGTTNTGAIDPLSDLADLCAEHDLWFHIDGAYGAFGVLDPCVASRYAGMERADSLSMDGHKWLGIPYECGCFFVRRKKHLEATFATPQPAYRHEPGAFHFTDWSYQLSRAFHALKVWMMLASTGKQQLAARIHQHNRLARLLASQIDQSSDFELLAPVTLSTVCFRYTPPGVLSTDYQWNQLNQQILERVQRSGTLMLSSTLLRERLALRACIVHAQTTEEDIMQILSCIRHAATLLRWEMDTMPNVV